MESSEDVSWMKDGACRDYPPNVFFPMKGFEVENAKGICKGCVVIEECREYALENQIVHGVWGGMSERERRRELKRRRLI